MKSNSKLNPRQDRHPNFRSSEGRLFLVRCFACEPSRGRENHISCIARGVCATCGWSETSEGKGSHG